MSTKTRGYNNILVEIEPDNELKQFERDYWVFTILLGILFVFIYWVNLSFKFRHTYELPVTSPGILLSDRWSFNFIREWTIVAYWFFIPFSGFLMLMNRTKTSTYAHIFIVLTLAIWGGVMVGFDITQVAQANLPPTHEYFDGTSLAYDNRWCCVYGGQPGANLYCSVDTNVVSCPPTSASQLEIDPIFFIRFILHLLIMAFIVYDLTLTWTTWLPKLNKFQNYKSK